MRRQQGVTLIELLISMALGLFIIAIVGRIYLTQMNLNHTLQDQLFLQENSQLALTIFAREVRTAGFIGCMRLQQGMNSQLTPENILQLQAQGNNTQITIRKMDATSIPIKSDDKIVISTCRTLKIISEKQLSSINQKNKAIAPLMVETFSLRNISGEKKSTMALYEKINHDNAVELVSGVDQLHAAWVKNDEGKPIAVHLQLHFTAPYGMTKMIESTIILRERMP